MERNSSILKEYVRSISQIGTKLDKKKPTICNNKCEIMQKFVYKECANVVYGILEGGDIIANSHSAIKELRLMTEQYPNCTAEIILEVIDDIAELIEIYGFAMKLNFCNCMNKPQ